MRVERLGGGVDGIEVGAGVGSGGGAVGGGCETPSVSGATPSDGGVVGGGGLKRSCFGCDCCSVRCLDGCVGVGRSGHSLDSCGGFGRSSGWMWSK